MAQALKLHLLLSVNIQILKTIEHIVFNSFTSTKHFLEITYLLRNWKALGKYLRAYSLNLMWPVFSTCLGILQG